MRPSLSYACAVAAGLFSPLEPFGPPTVAVQRYDGAHPGAAIVDVSSDGRIVAFESFARLLPADRNSMRDIYVLDRFTNRLTLESVSFEGHSADGSSSQPRVSGDGRYLVFESAARNLVSDWPRGNDETRGQIYLRDRHHGTTTLVSRAPDRSFGNHWSSGADISADGGSVVFESVATNLVVPDANGIEADVYSFDVEQQTITRVSVDRQGRQAARGSSGSPSVSGDGRFVTFASTAPLDDVAGQKPLRSAPLRQVFARDVLTSTTRLLSRTGTGTAGGGHSSYPAISGDGRFVAFVSTAADLVRDGGKARAGVQNVFLSDAVTGQVALVSRTAAGASGNGRSRHPAISGSGRYIAFESEASDLTCAKRCPDRSLDLNLVADVYLFDRLGGQMTRLSGSQIGSEPWWQASAGVAMDESGSVVVFSSRHPMNSADLAYDYDLFIRARVGPTSPFASLAGQR